MWTGGWGGNFFNPNLESKYSCLHVKKLSYLSQRIAESSHVVNSRDLYFVVMATK